MPGTKPGVCPAPRVRGDVHRDVNTDDFIVVLDNEHGKPLASVVNRIENCINAPDKVEQGYGERKIAQRVFDESHVLRVVYEERGDEILVITVYPGRRSRYE